MRLFIAFLFLTQFSFGQMNLGEIKGTIVDGNGEPGFFVRIVAISSNDSTRTMVAGCQSDFEGKFIMYGLVAGEYDLVFSSFEFDTLLVEGVKVIDERITFLNQLKMNRIDLGEAKYGIPMEPPVRRFEDLFGRSKTIKSEDIIRP